MLHRQILNKPHMSLQRRFKRPRTERKNIVQVMNSRHIEDNEHYKKIRKAKPIDLVKSVVYPITSHLIIHCSNYDDVYEKSKAFTNVKQEPDDVEHIYVFQNLETNVSKILLFEDEDDAQLFATLLEAECENQIPRISKVDTLEIITMCKEHKFACVLQPKGSMVTPMSLL